MIHTAAVFTDSKMTNSSHDQAPATPSYFNVCQGSSSEAGSGTSSCESHEAERRHTDNETEDSEDPGEVGDVDTIRRRHKPDRPPRTIDTQAAPPSPPFLRLGLAPLLQDMTVGFHKNPQELLLHSESSKTITNLTPIMLQTLLHCYPELV